MRFLLDLTHPAHVHFFRPLIGRLRAAGHEVRLTARRKDIVVELLARYGLEAEVIGTAKPGAVAMARELGARQARILSLMRSFRPHAALAIAGTYVALPGRLARVPTYVFYDTEHATLSNLLTYPFAICVYVPRAYFRPIRWRHQRYAGYHELAYLHPRYFTPDPAVLGEAGLEPRERFALVRFVAWEAAHDIGHEGLAREAKLAAVKRLAEAGRVLVSSEGALPVELEPMRLTLPVDRIHHLMAHASLIFGESATMPAEGAVLGVPGVYVNPLRVGTLEEIEARYDGLARCFRPGEIGEATEVGVELLRDPDRQRGRRQGRRLVEGSVDVTEMLWRIATERPWVDGRGDGGVVPVMAGDAEMRGNAETPRDAETPDEPASREVPGSPETPESLDEPEMPEAPAEPEAPPER